jgi:hypothetical protein
VLPHADAAKIYRHLNSQARKLSGNQSLQVFFVNPDALTPVLSAQLTEATDGIWRVNRFWQRRRASGTGCRNGTRRNQRIAV